MITFYPNCTLPTGHPSGFVTGPNIRSTLSIVWSCLGVILLSSLSVLHLNVPPPLETRKSRTRWPWLREMTYPVKIKLPWMALMLAAPEIVVGRAAANLLAAKQNYDHLPVQNPQPEEGVTHARGLAQQAKLDKVPWSLRTRFWLTWVALPYTFPTQRSRDLRRRWIQPLFIDTNSAAYALQLEDQKMILNYLLYLDLWRLQLEAEQNLYARIRPIANL